MHDEPIQLDNRRLEASQAHRLVNQWEQRYVEAPPIKQNLPIADKAQNPAGDLGFWLPQHDPRFRPDSNGAPNPKWESRKAWQQDMRSQVLDPNSALSKAREARERGYKSAIDVAKRRPGDGVEGRNADVDRLELSREAERTGWNAFKSDVMTPDRKDMKAGAVHEEAQAKAHASYQHAFGQLIDHDRTAGHPKADLDRDLKAKPYSQLEQMNWMQRPGREKTEAERDFTNRNGWDVTKDLQQEHQQKVGPVGPTRSSTPDRPWYVPANHAPLKPAQAAQTQAVQEVAQKQKDVEPTLSARSLQASLMARREREAAAKGEGEGKAEGQKTIPLQPITPKAEMPGAMSRLEARRGKAQTQKQTVDKKRVGMGL